MRVNDSEKLKLFADEVIGEALAIASKIENETDEAKRQAIDAGERRIYSDAYESIQAHIASLRRDSSYELSRHTMERRREYLLAREEIISGVLELAKKKLADFSESGAYVDYLTGLVLRVLSEAEASFTIYLSPRDMKYKYTLLEALRELPSAEGRSPVFSIEEDRTIKLGGARFFSSGNEESSGSIIINETFDERLRLMKDHLTLLVGKKIGVSRVVDV